MESYQDLPQPIREYLSSGEVFESEENVAKEFNLTEDQEYALIGVINSIALKQIPLRQFSQIVADEVGVSKEIAQAIENKIVASHFQKFEDFYTLEDANIREVETDLHQEKSDTPSPQNSQINEEAPESEHEKITKAIISSLGMDITDELLKKRLYNIVDSRLREVRTPQQFKDILGRPLKVGGLGFEADRVDMICKTIEKEFAAIQRKVKVERPAMGVAISEAKLPSTTKSAGPNVAKTAVPKSVLEKAGAGSAVPVSVAPLLPKQVQKPIPKPQAPEPPAKQIPIIVTRPAPSSLSPAREVIHDIKSEGVPLNLVDELSLIDLNEFRKMGLQNLKANIDSLAKESYAKKIAGIGAWRKSPVYRMYTELGNLSLETGSVGESVNAMKNKGMQTLTQEEFNAISEFNASLAS